MNLWGNTMMPQDEFILRKVNEETVSISGYQIPTKQIGCYLDIDGIMNYWQQLEKEGFPLVHTSSLLVALEFVHSSKKNMVSLLPFPMHIVRVVDVIHCAEFIAGGEQRSVVITISWFFSIFFIARVIEVFLCDMILIFDPKISSK
jgi:hypothetical protein